MDKHVGVVLVAERMQESLQVVCLLAPGGGAYAHVPVCVGGGV